MSAIQPIDVATPSRAMQAPSGTGPGVVEPGHPFAEMMRSAVSPARTAQSASYPSGTSVSSRAQSSRSNISTGTHSSGVDASVSMSSSSEVNGNTLIRTANQKGQNSDSLESVASSAVADGDDSLPVEGSVQSSILGTAIEDRLIGVTPQGMRTDATQAASSSSETSRKPISPAKEANGSEYVSGSSAIATATTTVAAPVPAIMPNLLVVNPPAAAQTSSSAATDSKYGTKSGDVHIPAKDSSLSNPATASGMATRIPQADGAGTAGMLSYGAQTGDEKHGVTSNLATTTASSAANQNSDPEGSSGSQPAAVADGTAHASANGISSSSADANPSNAVSATGTGNPGSVANDSAGNSGNGAATPIHGSNSSKSSDFTAAMPTPATAAKELPGSHVNPADSNPGLQNSSSVFSSTSHSGAPGSFPSSTTASTAPRATAADAFTALDSAASGERGVLLHAAPHQVAVGVSDPSLGWVEVRAERVSGQIAAALTTTSAASHAALTSVLPTMATYLQEHHGGVQQVHVESSLAGGQAGTGSQGQTASQSNAQTSSDNNAVASSPSTVWNAAPIVRATIPASQGTNFLYEGHHFSIRA